MLAHSRQIAALTQQPLPSRSLRITCSGVCLRRFVTVENPPAPIIGDRTLTTAGPLHGTQVRSACATAPALVDRSRACRGRVRPDGRTERNGTTGAAAREDLVGLDVQHHRAVAAGDVEDMNALDTEDLIGPGTKARRDHTYDWSPQGLLLSAAWSLLIVKALTPFCPLRVTKAFDLKNVDGIMVMYDFKVLRGATRLATRSQLQRPIDEGRGSKGLCHNPRT